MSDPPLTENERYQIYALKKAGHSQKEIATTLGRSPGTISRELRRNSGLKRYRPRQAQRLSDRRRREAHKSIKVNDEVWGWIVEWRQQALSPQQVVAYLRRHKGVSLRHETVYRLIYGDKAEGWSPSLPRGASCINTCVFSASHTASVTAIMLGEGGSGIAWIVMTARR